MTGRRTARRSGRRARTVPGLTTLGPALFTPDLWVDAGRLEVGGVCAATLAVTGYPREVGPAWMEPLLAYPGRLDVSLDYGKARTRGTLEMKTETMRPASLDVGFVVRGEVVRMAKQVAYGEASVRDADGLLVSRATGTFLLHRPD